MTDRQKRIIHTIWENTPALFQLFILVLGGMFLAWFFIFASVFIEDDTP